jgi:hypothetical protein
MQTHRRPSDHAYSHGSSFAFAASCWSSKILGAPITGKKFRSVAPFTAGALRPSWTASRFSAFGHRSMIFSRNVDAIEEAIFAAGVNFLTPTWRDAAREARY